MKLFIGWSDNPSKELAKVLRSWFPKVLQTVHPWMSETDTPPGREWFQKIKTELRETDTAIFCFTRTNHNAPWIHFEAGVVAFKGDDRVIPLIFERGCPPCTGPFNAFQHMVFDKANMTSLIKTFAIQCNCNAETISQVPSIVDNFWNDLENDISAILREHKDVTHALWGSFLNERTDMIFSIESVDSIDGERPNPFKANTYEQEFQAMVELFRFFIARGGDSLDLRARPATADLDSGARRRIVIGGPSRNSKIWESLNDKLTGVVFSPTPRSRSRFHKKWLKVDGQQWKVQYGETTRQQGSVVGRKVIKDYAISAKVSVGGIDTMILAGCHSFGTHAAAMAMTQDAFMSELYTKISKAQRSNESRPQSPIDFVALWEATIRESAVTELKLIKP